MNLRNNNNDNGNDNDNDTDNKRNSAFRKKYTKQTKIKHNTKIKETIEIKLASVLTRILPWGVPGPPLLRNRGPVRTLGGQSRTKLQKTRGTKNLSPHSRLSVT